MPDPPPPPSALHQLRLVFADDAPLLRFVPGVTMGDIARLWREAAAGGLREPIAASVLLADRARDRRAG